MSLKVSIGLILSYILRENVNVFDSASLINTRTIDNMLLGYEPVSELEYE